jgi:hypothetical protein
VVFVRSDWSKRWPDPALAALASLVGVPATGCLVEMGFPRFGGGLGGYARFVAICPPGTRRGVRVDQVPEAPLQKYARPLRWDTGLGMRVR